MTNPANEEKADASETMPPSDEPKGEKRAAANDGGENDAKDASPPKKAKIAMPPPVVDNILNVEKYTLDEGPPSDSTNESDEDVAKKVMSPCLILFGLHPLIREQPLKKLCEDYGTIVDITVRSAFANRYGHVEFETVEEARACYKALNGAKLLHKAIMVQPSKPQKRETAESKETVSQEQAVESN